MKPRGVDSVGRLVIPKPLREAVGISSGDDLDIYVEGSRIIIEKRNPYCIFCGKEENLSLYKGKKVCKSCLDDIKRY